LPGLKTLKRVLIYFFTTIGVLLIALTLSFYLYKDKIIKQFINEANKQLNTPVNVGKIQVSMFQDFPQLSIVLTDVYVEDSHKAKYPLLTAGEVSFQMNPLTAWNGDYTVSGLHIRDSQTTLKINSQGQNNYTIFKSSSAANQGAVKFELKDIVLENTIVRYLDLRAKQDFNFISETLNASIQSADNIYHITARGHLASRKIEIDGTSYFNDKSFQVSSELIYDDVAKFLTIKPSDLMLKKASFSVNGTYGWKEKNLINLAIEGQDTDIQTLLSLLPSAQAQKLEKYQSDGDVYFHSKLKGQIGRNKNPSLSVEFGFTNATIYHPDYKTKVEQATLRGSYATSDLGNPRMSSLILKDVNGIINGETFKSNFILHDFIDPEVICNFKGKVDAASVFAFYPLETVKEVTGSLLADIAFEGKVALLKNKATAQRVSTQGTIDLQHIDLVYGKEAIGVKDLNGALQFSHNDLALSNVTGKFGNSDFILNGFFKNIITFILFENQPIGIETDLKSQHVDLDQLFQIAFGTNSEDPKDEYTFSISPNIHLNFNCDISSLQYKKFHARNVKGDLLVKGQVAVSRNLAFASMGGDISLSGIVDAKNAKAIDVVSTLKLQGVNVDSAFYVFENFRQDFIEDRHLKGRATADVNLEMTFNEHLKLFPETLIADIGILIKNGELNNFEPLKKLSKYVDDAGLNKLRFLDLKNEIHIENKTVFVPQMEVHSNVTNLKISGTHTFNQEIDYRVVTPFRKRKIIDVDAQAAIEENLDGQTKLFLKIIGTTDDYRVAYDTDAVKKKIADDFKKEVQELKDAFKNKGKKKQKEIELQKDEYFEDW
jgi:hypothetical protein